MAKIGWENAARSWKLLSDAKLRPGSRDYEILAAPIVIFYARPFCENGGLTISSKYTDFSTSPSPVAFAMIHDRMLKARNRLVAHIDIPGSQKLINTKPDFERTDFLTVCRVADREFTFTTNSLLPDVVSSLAVPKLLAFQLSRILSQTVDTAVKTLGRRANLGETYRLINREARRTGIE